jgi:catalase (peroxidase I)
VSKALDVTEDRLDKGNYQYDPKTSELVRVPVSLKDANKVVNDMLERRDVIESKPQQEQIEKTVDDRLAKLAEQFRQFSKPKEKDITPKPLVIDN